MNKLLLTILLLASIRSTYSQTKNFIDQPYLEVVGEADTLITPNQIFIKITIAERDNKDKISIEDQEKKMLNAFKSLNINCEADLTTSDILSNYRFYLLKQKDVLKTKEYMLKVADATTASKVFIALEDIGLSNANIDHVNHSNMKNIANACKAKAIKDAQTKAIVITESLNQSIGNAIHITENNGSFDNVLAGRAS